MSFITRCPSCGTAFRVVTDQLRISEGWVRCGHCQHVFDATLDLQPWWPGQQAAELGGELPPDPVQELSQSLEPQPPLPEEFEPLTVAEPSFESLPEPPVSGQEDSQPEADAPTQIEPALEAVAEWSNDSVVTDPVDLAIAPAGINSQQVESAQEGDPASVPEPILDTAPFEETQPFVVADEKLAFVRQAEQRALWRSPWVRGGVALSVVVLLFSVLVQLVLFKRDELASRVPALRPALQAMCLPLGCMVNAPRSLQSVSIDSSALRRSSSGGYIFDMVVKNVSKQTLLTPALELTLTDAADRVIVRRVLPASEWPQAEPTLAPGSEHSVRFEWQLASPQAQTMSGYRALLFYP